MFQIHYWIRNKLSYECKHCHSRQSLRAGTVCINSFQDAMSTTLPKILILLSLCLLPGCRHTDSGNTYGIAVIDVINNLGNYQEVFVSEFVSELEYIPLETGNNCLIGAVRSILVFRS
jgi:hypothetical protein